MNNEVLVKVENVSKKFCRSLKRSMWYGMCDIAAELNPFAQKKSEIVDPQETCADPKPHLDSDLRPLPPSQGLRSGEFWAVDNVSFELRRGECLALIGRNGAGKTTLLKMLNGLIKPDHGRIEIRGRVGALIALGAGFNPILTGRENIYVNASVLGLTKREIDAKLDAIISFADIPDFIDSPVQSYSSGMQVRLGFAVATALEPDVLLIDEVLAVGDTSFRLRCYNRIRDLLPRTAVVFVSHSMFEIARICSRACVLESGRVFFDGRKEDGIYAYNVLNLKRQATKEREMVLHLGPLVSQAHVLDFKTATSGLDSSVCVTLSVHCKADIGDVRIRLVIHDDSIGEMPVAEWDSAVIADVYKLNKGDNRLTVNACRIRLRTARYRVIVVVADPQAQGYHVNIEHGLSLIVRNDALAGAPYRI